MRQLFVAALAAVFAGCASSPENPPFSAREVVELGRWPVQQDERQLGWVVLLEIQGGGHTFAHPFHRYPRIIGATNADLDAAAEIWRFFTDKRRRP